MDMRVYRRLLVALSCLTTITVSQHPKPYCGFIPPNHISDRLCRNGGIKETRWYYDISTGSCTSLQGCKGPDSAVIINNFDTEDDCRLGCLRVEVGNAMFYPSDNETLTACLAWSGYRGPCRAKIPRYYFDLKMGECKKFIYGGCDIYENNFPFIGDCQKTCSCRLQSHEGVDCGDQSDVFHYFYQPFMKACLGFTYSGCGGNENNFPTEKKCMQACN